MALRIPRRNVLLGAAATPFQRPKTKVQLNTPFGIIVLQLHTDRAPLSTTDFLKYVDARAYDGGRFFRVVRPNNDRGHPHIDVVQGGTRPNAHQGPLIKHESTALTGLRHLDGTVSLTRDAPGTGSGAGFFICIGPQPALDFGGTRNPDRQGFAAFGQVVTGMEVVRRIWSLDASGHSDDTYTVGQILTAPVPIIKARRI
jgi:peptidyl-prolyl cis-trans isomerase A (cyclophilin A)